MESFFSPVELLRLCFWDFSFFGSIGLLVKNSHSFQLSENLFISSLFIRIFLLYVELWAKSFFSKSLHFFQTFNFFLFQEWTVSY